MRTGKLQDDLGHTRGNLAHLETLLLQVYAELVAGKLAQVDELLAEAEAKQGESEARIPGLKGLLGDNAGALASIESADKRLADVRDDREQL